jgi:hypothetical protein
MPKDRETGKERETPSAQGEGNMTVREAGRLGGHKGGQRVRELIEEGKRAEAEVKKPEGE